MTRNYEESTCVLKLSYDICGNDFALVLLDLKSTFLRGKIETLKLAILENILPLNLCF